MRGALADRLVVARKPLLGAVGVEPRGQVICGLGSLDQPGAALFHPTESLWRSSLLRASSSSPISLCHIGKKIWSTNPLERLSNEIKRRTDVVSVSRTPPRCCA